MKQKIDVLFKYETYLFFTFLLINLVPVLFFKFLPTLDGPSHLHNANLIKNLLFTDPDILNRFYQLNNELLPNWSGHFMLALLSSFLPAWVADKIVIIAYLIFLPLSFRWFVKSINPENYLLSILIFPFCYSFTFFLGFYNFSFALIFLFMLLAYWNKIQIRPKSANILVLFLLFTALYFSHVFVFLIAIMAVGIVLLKQLAIETKSLEIKQSLGLFFYRIAIIVLTSGVGIFLSAKFLLSRSVINYTFIPKIELLKWIRDIRPTIVFNFGHEGVYTHIIFYLIVILTAISIIHKIKEITKTKPSFTELLVNLATHNDLWFVFSFFLLLLYFFMPDSNGYSGYFSVRIGLLLYLFYMVWIAIQKYPRWIITLSLFVVFFTNLGLNFYYIKQTRQLNKLAIEINSQSKSIENHKVVLPINFSTNWMHGHFSNYLGIDKPIVILENYECGTGYFPVKWNDNFPNTTIGDLSKSQFCKDWKTNSSSKLQYPVNFIFILGKQSEIDNNECAQQSIEKIEKHYHLISKTENTLLYKLTE